MKAAAAAASADVAMLMAAAEPAEQASWPAPGVAGLGQQPGPRRNAWVKAAPALSPVKAATPAAPPRRGVLEPPPVVPGPVRLEVGEASMRQAPPPPSAVRVDDATAAGAADVATALGRSWRAGWGPGGMLALPGLVVRGEGVGFWACWPMGGTVGPAASSPGALFLL